MANATGRPIAPSILSSDEREYLERQVRRHRVARSLLELERCRVILRCADGVPSKSVATELGVHEHTVGKWRRRFLKDRIEGLLPTIRSKHSLIDQSNGGSNRTFGLLTSRSSRELELVNTESGSCPRASPRQFLRMRRLFFGCRAPKLPLESASLSHR